MHRRCPARTRLLRLQAGLLLGAVGVVMLVVGQVGIRGSRVRAVSFPRLVGICNLHETDWSLASTTPSATAKSGAVATTRPDWMIAGGLAAFAAMY